MQLVSELCQKEKESENEISFPLPAKMASGSGSFVPPVSCLAVVVEESGDLCRSYRSQNGVASVAISRHYEPCSYGTWGLCSQADGTCGGTVKFT